MAKRRDTYTAVLLLAALAAVAALLLSGIIPAQGGMTARTRRSHRSDLAPKTKAVTLQAETRSSARHDRSAHKASRTPPEGRTGNLPLRNHAVAPVTLDKAEKAVEDFTSTADETLNDLLDRDHAFIELYGAGQRLLGRQVLEDPDPQYTVVRLENGLLTFASLEPRQVDMTVRATEMVDFAQRIRDDREYPLLYVQAPSKLNVCDLPEGMTDYADAEADQFLAILEENGVDTLDLRPLYRQAAAEDPEGAAGLFFRTDHHWTPAGAFLGYQALCDKLREDYGFDIDGTVTDPDRYSRYTFEGIFLGSQGRRVGSLYAGYDDLELWSPKFDTSLRYTVSNTAIDRKGTFSTTVLFPERLKDTSPYSTNPYTIYSGGDYLLARAANLLNPEGKRVLILRDSFGCTFTPFLSLACGEVMTMDPRAFDGNQDNIMTYLHWLRPDVVIVLNTTGSLRVDRLFPYLPTARAAWLELRRAGNAVDDLET